MQTTVFLDDSIVKCLALDALSIKPYIKTTKKWWVLEREKYQICMSMHSLFMLCGSGNRLDDGHLNKYSFIPVDGIKELGLNDNVLGLSKIYAASHEVRLTEDDARALAYASYYNIDFLLTWSCNHLANAHKRKSMRIMNAKLGLNTPEIATPIEFFKDELYFPDVDDDKDYEISHPVYTQDLPF